MTTRLPRVGRGHPRLLTLAVATLAAFVAPAAHAQTAPAASAASPLTLTLEEAVRLATDRSTSLDITRAGESRADADLKRANSQRLPQVNFAGSYDRTLASEFSSVLGSASVVPCPGLSVDASKPLADRVAEIERAASCGGLGPSFNFSSLPFGQRNIYRLTFSFSQPIYTGGRIAAQRTQADLSRRAAELTTSAARAQVALDVTRAFFDAALSDRLLAIAESGYKQASAAYEQARQAYDAGRQPEFERLRAQVARDNQQPIVIRRRADREIAYLRLRQLLELPAGTAVTLDVNLEAEDLAPPPLFAEALAKAKAAGAPLDRVTVQQAETVVHVREAGIAVARSERRPSLTASSSFGKVGYPSDGFLPGFGDFRTNWTVGAQLVMPLFTGGRLKADEQTARADLSEAEARLKQTRELSEVDAATAREDLSAAEATWTASAGTVQQAQRAYEIAEVRYSAGISTQLELSDSRLSLQMAQANRAQAARDLQLARVRVALLPALPVR